ncbi:hypothetical protein KFK09_008990 [Dendrobium nobile]|uniref:Uncharacterized protein n=1 Tax=Dendrobium nobile TaxID=94219 RepID=A0A8T3BPI7_DENNO|nr:hypothetical protein KFK09_008990 [Dendrobium nobile]
MKGEDQKTHYNNYHNNLNMTSIKTPKSSPSPLLTEISPKPGTEEQPRKPRRSRGNQGAMASGKSPGMGKPAAGWNSMGQNAKYKKPRRKPKGHLMGKRKSWNSKGRFGIPRDKHKY